MALDVDACAVEAVGQGPVPAVKLVDRLVVVLGQVGEGDHPTIGVGFEREVELDLDRAGLGRLVGPVGRLGLGGGWFGCLRLGCVRLGRLGLCHSRLGFFGLGDGRLGRGWLGFFGLGGG